MIEFTESEINQSEYLLVATETGGPVLAAAFSHATKQEICTFICYCLEFGFDDQLADFLALGRTN